MLLLEAVAALLLTLASALVILAVIAADGWDEAERPRRAEDSSPPWRNAA